MKTSALYLCRLLMFNTLFSLELRCRHVQCAAHKKQPLDSTLLDNDMWAVHVLHEEGTDIKLLAVYPHQATALKVAHSLCWAPSEDHSEETTNIDIHPQPVYQSTVAAGVLNTVAADDDDEYWSQYHDGRLRADWMPRALIKEVLGGDFTDSDHEGHTITVTEIHSSPILGPWITKLILK